MDEQFDKSMVYEALDFDITAAPDRPDPIQEKNFESEDQWILALSAGWMRGNPVSAWSHRKINEWVHDAPVEPTFEADHNYRAFEDEDNYGYPASEMVTAVSKEQAAYMRNQFDKEWADIELINSTGWGLAGELGGAILRPELALGGVAGIGRGLGTVIGIEMGVEMGSEMWLQKQQIARTTRESVINIAAAGIFTGFLGKAADMASNLRTVPAAQAADNPALDTLHPKGDSAGAQRSTSAPEDDRLVGGSIMDKIAVGPDARLTKSDSDTARGAAKNMTNKSFYTRGMEKGETPGVSVEAEKEAMVGEVLTTIDKMDEMALKSGMTRKNWRGKVVPDQNAFHEQVGVAMSNNDIHVNPQVQAAARLARAELLDPRLDDLVSIGHKIEVEDGKSYFPRVYKRAEVMEGFHDLKNTLVKHYSDARSGAIKAAARGVSKTEAKLFSANTKMVGKMQNLVKALSVKPARKRTAQEIVKLDKARKQLKAARADNAKMLAKQAPRVQIKALQTEIGGIKKTKANKAKLDKLREKVKVLKAQQIKMSKEAGKVVRATQTLSGDIMRDAELDAAQTIQNMMGGIPHSTGVGGSVPSAVKQRTLDLTDQILEPYLEKNASTVLSQYTSGVDAYVLMGKRFGDTGMKDTFDGVIKEYGDLIKAAPDAKSRNRLKNKRDSDLEDLRVMRDRMLNRVQDGTDSASAVSKVVQHVKVFNIATQLGGIMLSSAPDMARPLMAYGMRSFSNGLGRGMRQFARALKEGNTNATSAQIRRLGVASQRTLNTRMLDMAELGSNPGSTWFTRNMPRWWAKGTGFNHWTDAMETVTAHSAMDWTLRMGKKVVSGQPLSRSETMKIARMGFVEGDVANFYGKSIATSSEGGLDPIMKFADTLEWNDPDLARMFEAGIGSDVRRAIVRIGVGDKPLGMDKPIVSLIFQYMSFAIAATNKMLVAGLQQRDATLLQGLLASLFLGSVVGMSKGWLRGDDPGEWPNDKFLAEGVDRSGMLGVYNHGLRLLRTVSGDLPTAYAQRSVSGIIGGSTVGQAGRVGEIVVDAGRGEMDAKTAENIQRLIPLYSNALHMRQLMQQIGDME